MKAQSYQVETVITLGLGLLAAISIISFSGLISTQITSDIVSAQVKTAGYTVASGIKKMESVNSDSSTQNISLSQVNIEADFLIQGTGSQIELISPELEEDIVISGFDDVDGSADTQNITIINEGNQVTIR